MQPNVVEFRLSLPTHEFRNPVHDHIEFATDGRFPNSDNSPIQISEHPIYLSTAPHVGSNLCHPILTICAPFQLPSSLSPVLSMPKITVAENRNALPQQYYVGFSGQSVIVQFVPHPSLPQCPAK
jgi:hypothetical protein